MGLAVRLVAGRVNSLDVESDSALATLEATLVPSSIASYDLLIGVDGLAATGALVSTTTNLDSVLKFFSQQQILILQIF